jgi:hypothetical protein
LSFSPWESTAAQRKELRALKEREYHFMNQQWYTMLPIQEPRFGSFTEHKSKIGKYCVKL